MNRSCTEQQFLKDVTNHTMTVHTDIGMVRVLVFQQPGTINLMFVLTTWPGYLCISGDMGTYVFSRLADMFQFFRSEGHESVRGLFINLPYWEQKLKAVDKNSNVKEYSYEIFKQIVQERIDEAETTKKQRDAIEHLVESLDGEDITEVHRRVSEFDEFDFTDFWEHDLTEYTYHFIWICYAIAWGGSAIRQSQGGAPWRLN